MKIIVFIFLLTFSIGTNAQVELSRIGQTPGGSGYHVNYDSLSHRLFVGAGTSLWVYDMTDINNPKIIGKRPFLGLITETILFDSNTLMVSATFDGIYAIDLSSPDLPVIAHKYIDGTDKRAAYDMILKGDTLIIPTNVCNARLKYSNSTGFTPLPDIGPFALFFQGNVFCIAEKGDYIAMGVRKLLKGEVQIYNKNDLNNYIAVYKDASIKGISKIRFSDRNNNILYICGGSSNAGTTSHFLALNFDGKDIKKLDSYDINGIPVLAAANIQNMDIRNDTLYIATGCAIDTLKGSPLSYIPIIDATELPSGSLKEIDYVNTGLWNFDVSLIRGTPYMATASEWLGIAINNIFSGIPLDTLMLISTGGWTQKSKIRGDTLWVAHEGWGLAAYKIDSLLFSNGFMTNSLILHIYNPKGKSHRFVGDFEFLNDTLIILSSGTVYNIKPWKQGGSVDSLYHLNFTGEIHKISTNRGQRIVVGSLYSMSIYDPFVPNSNALTTINSANNTKSITVNNDTVFYGSKNNISSPSTVYLVASKIQNDKFIPIDSISTGPGQINSIAVEKNIVAVGKNTSIQFYSLDGSNFTYIDSYDNINMSEVDIKLINNYLYIADKKNGVIILDISGSNYPVVGKFEGRGTWTNLFGSENIEIANDGKIFLSDFNAGVIIIEAFDTTLTTSNINMTNEIGEYATIYPNPTMKTINIEIDQQHQPENKIIIYNIKGQEIFANKYYKNNITISTPGLKAGIYFVTIMNKYFTETKRIVIE